MFCPNCGTKNDDTATPCKKCGFKLSGASAPKFRGTMMLNSDQSVQEMVEAHRKKLEDGGASPPGPPEAGGPTPPLPSVGSSPPKAVLQPPRASLPKRRMGTMLGVAPQVGGVRPPDEGRAVTPTPPPSGSLLGTEPEATPPSAADPYAGTVAFGAVSPSAPGAPSPGSAEAFTAGRTEAFAVAPAAPPAEPSAALAAGRTEAFDAPALAATATPASAPEPAPAASPAEGRTEALAANPGVGSPEMAETAASTPPPPQRRRVRPLEVFLILVTCGLYGLVSWARQRKQSPAKHD